MLSAEQVDDYHRNGFVVIEEFLSGEACDRLRRRANEIVDAWQPTADRTVFTTNQQTRVSNREFLESGSSTWCFFEEDAFGSDGELRHDKHLSINKIGHAQHDLDDEFARIADDARLAAIARDVGMSDPRALQSMYIFKQPHIGGEVTCHQDATFLFTDPITVTGFWFAIEDAMLHNGCLWAEPGGHRGPLRQRYMRIDPDDPTRADDLVFEILDDAPLPTPPNDPNAPDPTGRMVPLPVAAGTLIVLHGLLPHWSAPNRSATSRHAYSLHCIDGTATYPAWNWLQRPPDMPLRTLG